VEAALVGCPYSAARVNLVFPHAVFGWRLLVQARALVLAGGPAAFWPTMHKLHLWAGPHHYRHFSPPLHPFFSLKSPIVSHKWCSHQAEKWTSVHSCLCPRWSPAQARPPAPRGQAEGRVAGNSAYVEAARGGVHRPWVRVLYALLDTAVTAACVASIIYNKSWSPWRGARGGGPGAEGAAAKPGVEKPVKTA